MRASLFALAVTLLLSASCGGPDANGFCLFGLCNGIGLGSAQTAVCKAYVACYERTGGTKGALDSTYGPMGTCWSMNNSAVVESCSSACRSALPTLRSSFPDAGCQ